MKVPNKKKNQRVAMLPRQGVKCPNCGQQGPHYDWVAGVFICGPDKTKTVAV